jgi:hypothetical protein
MIDNGDSQLAVADGGGRLSLADIVDERRRPRREAGELPAQEIEKASRLRSIGIEEPPSVKMFWKDGHRFKVSLNRICVAESHDFRLLSIQFVAYSLKEAAYLRVQV